MTTDGTAYHLGIDLGTTYVAAGILAKGRPEIITLGDRSAVLPSVLYFRPDGEVLTGESATRRGLSDPGRVVREFKRRVGDTTPVIVGQTPYSVDVLMAKLVRFVHDSVVERQGAAPESIAITHPANWGPYKVDVLEQAVRIAELGEVATITEPVAAAIHYAAAERLQPGQTVAVYDLGGGTFDAAVLRKTETDFEVLGEVEGIERLGGIDFDEAVFQHVVRFCESSLAELDIDDPAAMQALARLRQECIEAKEVLSTDTDVTIPVVLPNHQTEVRLTRAEFEAMIRPLLQQTVEALRRAIRSAGIESNDLSAVLLVGGSSRIPLIAEMVGAELGRPIAVDRHPKHTVALGAAISAGRSDQAPEPQVDDWFRTEPSGPAADTTQTDRSAGAALAAAAGAGAAANADDMFAMFPLKEEESAADSQSTPSQTPTGQPAVKPAAATNDSAAGTKQHAAPAAAPAVAAAATPAAVAAEAKLSSAEQVGSAAVELPVAPTQAPTPTPTPVAPTPIASPAPGPRPSAPDSAASGPGRDGSTLSFSTSHAYPGPQTAANESSPRFEDQQLRSMNEPSRPVGRMAAMAAAAVIAVLTLGGAAWAFTRGNSGGETEVATEQLEAGEQADGSADGDPAGPDTNQNDGQQGQGNLGDGTGDDGTNNGDGGNGGGDDGGGGDNQTGTTVAGNTDTTVSGDDTTTTTEDDGTTTTSTTKVEAVPIRIVSGPTVNSRGATTFQFNYTTNDVCGTGSFSVREKDSGKSVGSYTGNNICFGPLHGGHPNGGSATFAGFDLNPGTTYVVVVRVRGTASDGVRTAGSGTATTSFQVTTTGTAVPTTTSTTAADTETTETTEDTTDTTEATETTESETTETTETPPTTEAEPESESEESTGSE